MVIVKLNEIIFRGSDNHTVGYRRRVIEFLAKDKEKDDLADIRREIREGQFKWVVESTMPAAIESMRKQVADHLDTISWLKADLDDFYFTVIYENVENGLCWPPATSNWKKYRVSDLKEWN